MCFWPGNNHIYQQSYFRNFSEDTKSGYGVEIVIMFEKDIKGLFNKAKNFANIVDELKTQPWGLKDFRIEDPFGYYLRLTEPHDILHESNAVK